MMMILVFEAGSRSSPGWPRTRSHPPTSWGHRRRAVTRPGRFSCLEPLGRPVSLARATETFLGSGFRPPPPAAARGLFRGHVPAPPPAAHSPRARPEPPPRAAPRRAHPSGPPQARQPRRGTMLDFAIFAVTFLLALVAAVLYLCPASRQAAGIPGITPTEEKDGNLPDIVNSGSLHEFLVNLHERFGPVVSFWFGRRLVVSLGTVDALKQHINPDKTADPFETILKSLLRYQPGDGSVNENHLRKKLYESGVTKSLQSNFALLLKLSEEVLNKWLSYPESQHIPLGQHMLGFAMKSVTQLVLGSTFEDEQEVIRFQKNHGTVWSEIGKGFLDGSLDKSMTRKKQYEDALLQLESSLKKIIKERKGKNFSQHTFIDSLVQEKLHDQQILEDSMIFSLAGCIITAKLCTWAICFLTTSEEVQKKLYQELDRVLGKGPITSEKIEQLRYCRQVLCETVRTAKLTPVSAQLQDAEGRIDQFVIPRETLILYALGVVLQDPNTWPSPHKFDPDRFDDAAVMQAFSLLGFSGTRECPELRFAYIVTTVLLSVLVKRLHLLSVEGQSFETKYELVTSSREEVWITVSKRY